MTDHAHTALAEPWRRLWSGDLGLLDQIVADDIVVHAAPMGGGGSDRLEGRAALGSWIGAMHAVMADISFAVEIGPIADVRPPGAALAREAFIAAGC